MANNNQNTGKDLSGFMDAQMQATQIANQRADILKQARLLENNAASNTALVAQASQMMLGQGQQGGLSQSTQNILGKYGMKPGTSKSSQVSQGPGGSTIVNNTTNNIQIAPPPAVRQGPNSDTEKVKAWMNGVLNKQAEQSNIRMRELDRRESFLSRSSEKIGSSLAKLSKSVVTGLDPRRMSKTFGDSLGSTLKMIGLYRIISNWDKIMNFLVNMETGVKSVLSWLGFNVGGGGKWNVRKGAKAAGETFFGSDFYKNMSDIFVGSMDFLFLKFKHFFEKTGKSVSAIPPPNLSGLSSGDYAGALSELGSFFKSVLSTAFSGGSVDTVKKEVSSRASEKVKSLEYVDKVTEDSDNPYRRSPDILPGGNEVFSSDNSKIRSAYGLSTGFSNGRAIEGYELSKGNLGTLRGDLDEKDSGLLTNSVTASVRQSAIIGNAFYNARKDNKSPVGMSSSAVGMKRLFNTAKKYGWLATSPIFVLNILGTEKGNQFKESQSRLGNYRKNIPYLSVRSSSRSIEEHRKNVASEIKRAVKNLGLTQNEIALDVALSYLERQLLGNWGAVIAGKRSFWQAFSQIFVNHGGEASLGISLQQEAEKVVKSFISREKIKGSELRVLVRYSDATESDLMDALGEDTHYKGSYNLSRNIASTADKEALRKKLLELSPNKNLTDLEVLNNRVKVTGTTSNVVIFDEINQAGIKALSQEVGVDDIENTDEAHTMAYMERGFFDTYGYLPKLSNPEIEIMSSLGDLNSGRATKELEEMEQRHKEEEDAALSRVKGGFSGVKDQFSNILTGSGDATAAALNEQDRIVAISKGQLKSKYSQFEKIYNLLKKALPDLKPHQIAGLMSHLYHESHFDTKAVNPNGGAAGIGQWLSADRRTNFRSRYGKDVADSTLEEQIDFIKWELENTHKEGLRRLKAAKTGEEAASAAFGYYGFSAGERAGIEDLIKTPGHGGREQVEGNFRSRLALGQVLADLFSGNKKSVDDVLASRTHYFDNKKSRTFSSHGGASTAITNTNSPPPSVEIKTISTSPSTISPTSSRTTWTPSGEVSEISPVIADNGSFVKVEGSPTVSSIGASLVSGSRETSETLILLSSIDRKLELLREDYRIGTSLINGSIVDSGTLVAQQVINTGGSKPAPIQALEQPIITPSTNYVDTTTNYS